MGIFQDNITLVNRAPEALTIRFDGQEMTLPPGESPVPAIVVPYAKNQHPIMGTCHANNPNISGGTYLVGVKAAAGQKQKDDIEPLTPEEWATHLGKPCRIDMDELFEEEYGNDPKAVMQLRGKGKKTMARSLHETDVKGRAIDSEAMAARD